MKKQEIIGAVTEHWMDKRLREKKPINLVGNLIRISANDLLRLHEYKNHLLGISVPLSEVAHDGDLEREEYLY